MQRLKQRESFEFGGGVCMIGFSIMMWFVSFVILMVAISLLRGNVSTMHGKVFDTTEDKVGYGKQLGKVSLFISIGLCTCGVVAFLIKSSMAIVYALVILLAVIVVSAIWFVFIQKRYMRESNRRFEFDGKKAKAGKIMLDE